MDRQLIAEELRNIIGDYLQSQGLDLVDFIYRYEGRDLFLRILTDRPQGGITLDDCSFLNSEIGRILEEKDIVRERFILEVFSPGLDRPLKTKNDFLRCMNKKVKFFLNVKINGKLEIDGIVTGATDEAVIAQIEGQALQVPLSKINKGKQII